MDEFVAENGDFYVTQEVRASFDRNGFVLVRGLWDQEEVGKLRRCMEGSQDIQRHAFGRSDGRGAASKMCLWGVAGDDAVGLAARSRKVAGTLEQLLGGRELYHHHSKLMMKEARTGGAHLWHQDYGYWYQTGCLAPDMGSVFMPVDRCTRANSCLQVLAGSHRLGRIDHFRMGGQAGADPERVELARLGLGLAHLHVLMEPGDALFFHCNLLHTSDQNTSDLRRWAMISSYNQVRNAPEGPQPTGPFRPLLQVANSAVRECERMESTVDKEFMDPDTDKSAASLSEYTKAVV